MNVPNSRSWGLSPARAAALAALGRPELVPARVVAAVAGRWRVVSSGRRTARRTHRPVAFRRGQRRRPPRPSATSSPSPRAPTRVAPPSSRCCPARVCSCARWRAAPSPRNPSPPTSTSSCSPTGSTPTGTYDASSVSSRSRGRAARNPSSCSRRPTCSPTPPSSVGARIEEAARVAVGAPVVAVASPTGVGLDALRVHLPRRRDRGHPRLLGRGEVDARQRAPRPRRPGHGPGARPRRPRPPHHHLARALRDAVGRLPRRHARRARDRGPGRTRPPSPPRSTTWPRWAPSCRFRDCAHVAEPGCAVLAAIASGDLDATRLEDYRHLLREQAFLARKTDVVARKAERERWKKLGQAGRDAMRRKRGE